MQFYWLLLGILVVWRISHLCTTEDGPWDALARVRRALRSGPGGKLLTCFYCLSLWVSAPVAVWLGERWPERLLLWPALSAGAILLERATRVEPAVYREDREDPTDPSGQGATSTAADGPPASS